MAIWRIGQFTLAGVATLLAAAPASAQPATPPDLLTPLPDSVQLTVPAAIPVTSWQDVYAELEADERASMDALRSGMTGAESWRFLEFAHFLPVGARGQISARLLVATPLRQRAFLNFLTKVDPDGLEDMASRSIDLERGTFDWLLDVTSRKPADRLRYILFVYGPGAFPPPPPIDPPLDEQEQEERNRYWVRVLGVTNAELAEEVDAPWQAQIYKSGDSASPLKPLEVRRERENYGDTLRDYERWHDCGGVVIGKRWVLTAAHCIKTPRLGPYLDNRRVRTGTTNIVSGGTSWRIAAVARHSGYDPVKRVNDIALLMLAPDRGTDNAANSRAKIARLPANGDPPLKIGEALTVTGWGVTAETPIGSRFRDRLGRAKRASPLLMLGRLANAGAGACNRNQLYVQSNMHVGKGQICAIGNGRVDACQGDSGGPLVRRIRGRPTVVGLVSYGMGCGLEDTPGVYVDITAYRGWIQGAQRAMHTGKVQDWPPKAARR